MSSKKPHFRRNDLKNSVTIPQHLNDLLLRIGGTNPYGEPMFRLCLAEDRITKAAGMWNIWAEDASLDDRCGLGVNEAQQILAEAQQTIDRLYYQGVDEEVLRKVSLLAQEEVSALFDDQLSKRPERVIKGINEEVPLYQCEGYIVERWKPAHCFGSPSQWESYTFEGDCVLGPYPHYGDYELIAGPSPYMPSEAELAEAVKHHMHNLREKPSSPVERVRQLLATMEKRNKDRMRHVKNQAESFRKDGVESIRNRVSLGAGRVRQELATKAGIKGHYGN